MCSVLVLHTLSFGLSSLVRGERFRDVSSENGIRGYGAEVEINAHKFINIGFTFGLDGISGQLYEDYNFSSTLADVVSLTMLVRAFYLPQLGSLQTRVSLKGTLGPGAALPDREIYCRASVSAGWDVFINAWFGGGISYGQTLLLGNNFSYRASTLEFLLKTTFF